MSASIPESHKDLLTTGTATLTTQSKSGYPQTTALWFIYENDTIKLSLNNSRQKVKNLVKNPKCTFFIIDPAQPLRTLEVRANATVGEDVGGDLANKIVAKYGMDPRQMDGPGEVRIAVTLEPVKVNALNLAG